ncbi:MAG TPA: amidohydrolase family protein [Mycobacteriales bacterium]|nr:amidohydrolase family protein [Mycobacteriales bacterium]
MLDLLLRGGEVVDGTGAPRRCADVGIRAGRIVSIGPTEELARRSIDVDGLVVAPGFVDIHTHYDAQLLWDPSASPSPLHGVTTVFGGNCGFTIAPLDDNGAGYVAAMMAKVEGMPLAALQSASWSWRSFGDYLDTLENRVGPNVGFLAGHSTLRRMVLGEDAVGGELDEAGRARIVELAHQAMNDGAIGLSSSLGEAHTDGDDEPVPSRYADRDEFLALASAVGKHPGTTLEFIPGLGEIAEDRAELMADMSLAAGRPLNWNLLGSLSPTEVYAQQLTASDRAAGKGAHVVALTLPDLMRLRADRVLDALPGWKSVVRMPDDERRTALADPATRQRLRDGAAKAAASGIAAAATPELIEVAEAAHAAQERYVGRTIADIAAERGVDAIDVLLDVVLPDRLPLTMVLPSLVPSLGASDEGWERRVEVWRDPRVVIGGSDAGAHLDLMCHANYTTRVLSEAVRRRGLMSLEEAVHQLTDVPARLYGLSRRGRVAEGWHADLVVFDPDTVDSAPARARDDLPGGGMRLFAEGVGIKHVFVAGVEIVTDDVLTGATPGTVLRSGRDTETVSI